MNFPFAVANPIAKSLARQFWIFLLGVALFGIVTLGVLGYQSERRALENQLVEKLSTVATFKATELESWFDERQSDARMLAENRLNQEHFTEIFEPSIPMVRKTEFIGFLRDNLRSLQDARIGYTEVSFVSISGQVIISTDTALVGHRVSHTQAFEMALQSPDGQGWQDMYVDESIDGAPVMMAFSHIVHGFDLTTSEVSDEVIGVILTVVNMQETIYPFLQETSELGAGSETLLARAEGDATVFLNPLLYNSSPPLSLAIAASDTNAQPAHRSSRGYDGAILTPDYRGKPVLAVYRHVAGPNWGFVAKQDVDQAFAPVDDLALRSAVLALGVLLLAGLLAVVAARALARPINELVLAAQAVAAGDLSVSIHSSRQDEIGALADSFDQMIAALGKREAQVQTATQMLERLNGTPDVRNAFLAVADGLRRLIHFESVNLATYHPQHQWFEIVATDPPSQMMSPGLHVCVTESAVTPNALAGNIHLTPDLSQEQTLLLDKQLFDAGYRSRMSIPLLVENRVVGLLSLGWLQTEGYQDEDLPLLAQFAGALALALERSRLFSETLQRAQDLERAYADLRRSDRMKDEFIRNVTHELRTPVATLSGYSELLQYDDTSNLREEQAEMLEIVADQTERVSQLVNDIIALHQVWNGKAAPEPVSLLALAQQSLDAQRPLAPANVTLALAHDGSAPQVLADAEQLRRVLSNLLSNAVKFSPDGGRIQLSVGQATEPASGANGTRPAPSQWAEIVVADEGIGMTPEQLSHIWDRFYQGDGSATRRFGGTGLGLALVKEVVEAHGGRVWATSQPGIGSRIGIQLPPATPAADPSLSGWALTPKNASVRA